MTLKKYSVFLLAALSCAVAEAQQPQYPLSFDADADYTHATRRLTSVGLKSPADGQQTVVVAEPRKPYTNLMGHTLKARRGDWVTPSIGFTTDWMHGYVYVDLNRNGQFDVDPDAPAKAGSELLSCSYLGGKTWDGKNLTTAANNYTVAPPMFRLPTDMEQGVYVMRYKVDWDDAEPGGSTEPGNELMKNGGAVADIRLEIHGTKTLLSAAGSEHGTITLSGEPLTAQGVEVAYGKSVELTVTPVQGYTLEGLRLRYGYNLAGDSLVQGVPQYVESVVPSFLMPGGVYSLPAEYMSAETRVEAIYAPQQALEQGEGDYALAFDRQAPLSPSPIAQADLLTSISAEATQSGGEGGGGATTIKVAATTAYADLTLGRQLSALPGDRVVLTLGSAPRTALHAYLYVDYNQDGQFHAALDAQGRPTLSGELVSYSYAAGRNSLGEALAATDSAALAAQMPAFTLPELLPVGAYRARLVLATDCKSPLAQGVVGPDGQTQGQVVDLLLSVHKAQHRLRLNTRNCNIYANNASNRVLPEEITPFQSLAVLVSPVADGYAAQSVQVRHGLNLDGPQWIRGNRQWSQYEKDISKSRLVTMVKDTVNGDVEVRAWMEPTGQEDLVLVFSDEFEGKNGSRPDPDKWVCSPRAGSAWNRYIVDSPTVAYQQDGNLVCLAVPDGDKSMKSGAVETRGKFDWSVGRIECRLKVDGWKGSFPAFWMMPTDNSAGWPNAGEIDVFESINAENKAYGTIHTGFPTWGRDNSRGGNVWCDLGYYHTYALEWTDDCLTWFMDGNQFFQVWRSNNQADLDNHQWPFDRPFYIILNQSVGNGGWAAAPDFAHTYRTRFDWVRVYQPKRLTGVRPLQQARQAGSVAVAGQGYIDVSAPEGRCRVDICDLQGRRVASAQVSGTQRFHLPQGVYLVGGRKLLVR